MAVWNFEKIEVSACRMQALASIIAPTMSITPTPTRGNNPIITMSHVRTILTTLSPEELNRAEAVAHKWHATESLYGADFIQRLLPMADREIARQTDSGIIIVKLSPAQRSLNIAEQIVLAIRIRDQRPGVVKSTPRIAASHIAA